MFQPRSFLSHFLRPWGWAALGAAVVLAIVVVLANLGATTAQRLAEEGVDTTAEVTNKRRIQDRDSDGDIDYRYEVEVRFTAGDQVYEQSRRVSYRFYMDVTSGDRLPIRYWAGDPTVFDLEPGNASRQALAGKIVSGVVGLITLILASLGWRRASAAAWMVRHGVERRVKVTGHVDTNVKVNKQPRYRATWTHADGSPGATGMRRREDLPQIGSEIAILVDPQGRRKSMWKDDL